MPRVDAYIKVIKYLGFPIVFGGVMLWIFWELIGDYRASIKESTIAQKQTADALLELKVVRESHMKQQLEQTKAVNDTLNVLREIMAERRDIMREMIEKEREKVK
jgi:hypothetical protein